MDNIDKIIDQLVHFDRIDPDDLPNIDLYMDQVTTFMESQLSGCKRNPEDKILTKTMINNYSKNKLLPPSDRKKYSSDHIILLVYIYYLKNFLSISDIKALLTPLINEFHDNPDSKISLEDIYRELNDMETTRSEKFHEDVIGIYKDSQTYFQDVTDEKQKEFLQRMSFLMTLSYDIYLKKQIIEGIIDHYIPKEELKKKEKTKKAGKK